MRFAKKERKDLATAIGKTVQAVGSVINGRTHAFTAENNANAANFLGVNADWLATGKGEMAAAPPELERLAEVVARLTSSGKMQITEVQAMVAMLNARESTSSK